LRRDELASKINAIPVEAEAGSKIKLGHIFEMLRKDLSKVKEINLALISEAKAKRSEIDT